MAAYYTTLSKFPEFQIMNNDADGVLPVVYIDNWIELQDILKHDFFKERGKELVFRGQEDFSWALVPSLGRLNKAGIIQTELAEKHKEIFRLSIRGRIEDSNLLENDIELWALGQHNGLQTPLLDWSYSPFIALFFAFERDDSLEENEDSRAIYVLNKKALEELDADLFIQPRRNDHVRLINQAGLFTISPRDTSDTLESHIIKLLEKEAGVDISDPNDVAYYICKIHIPNLNKVECLRHLRLMNIHHASLFPDLMGSSQYCNELTQEYSVLLDEQEVDEAEDGEEKELIPLEYESLDDSFISEYFNNTTNVFDGLGETQAKEFSVKLAEKLSSNLTIDWTERDSSIAKLKNLTRLELRKLGVHADTLNEISGGFVSKLIELEQEKLQSEGSDD